MVANPKAHPAGRTVWGDQGSVVPILASLGQLTRTTKVRVRRGVGKRSPPTRGQKGVRGWSTKVRRRKVGGAGGNLDEVWVRLKNRLSKDALSQ